MIWIISTLICSVVALYVILDFYVKRFTAYELAKSLPGPRMFPIIGATNFLFSSDDSKTNNEISVSRVLNDFFNNLFQTKL